MAGLNIIFMGSPDFACPTLDALISAHNVCHVLTQPPRKAGRGQAERPTPVASLAMRHCLPTSWPASLKETSEIARLSEIGADLFVVVAYGLILPKAVLDLPRLGCVNGHASLLPRWRGAAPIQRAIGASDKTTGTCAMMMEEGLDTGPVIATATTEITEADTAASLQDRLAIMTADTLVSAIDKLADGTAIAVPQSQDGITYAAKIQKSEAALDFTQPAPALRAQIHALSPFPGCYVTGASGKRLKCLTARLIDNAPSAHAAGTYLGQDQAGDMMIACGQATTLCLSTLQPAGKTTMPAADFLRGTPLIEGQDLAEQL